VDPVGEKILATISSCKIEETGILAQNQTQEEADENQEIKCENWEHFAELFKNAPRMSSKNSEISESFIAEKVYGAEADDKSHQISEINENSQQNAEENARNADEKLQEDASGEDKLKHENGHSSQVKEEEKDMNSSSSPPTTPPVNTEIENKKAADSSSKNLEIDPKVGENEEN
jgi:hypothetical protein